MKLIDPEKFRQPLVLFHGNCWDGFCAAWIAWRYFDKNIEAIPVQYGQEPPDTTQRRVFILDFSYPRETLLKMNSVCRSMLLLDHHKSAVEELKDHLPFMHRLEEGKSGGRLTWEHFHGKYEEVPWLVDYTEDRDLWRHALPNSMEVNAALRSWPLNFEMWDGFNDGHPEGLVQDGLAIRRREKQIVEEHVRHAREVEISGHRVPVVNATVLYSEIAGELAKGKPFAATYLDRSDGKRQWSLRSDDNGLDVSAIAKAHGGGGHFHAAGYEEKI